MTRSPTTQRAYRGWLFVGFAGVGIALQWYLDAGGRLVSGSLILIGYAWLAGVMKRGADEDLADAPYFLGFLLTVTLLAVAFLQLEADGSGSTLEVVLQTVGQGLILTALGLALRQVAVLQSAPQEIETAPVGAPPAPPIAASAVGSAPYAGDEEVSKVAAEARREMVGALEKLRKTVGEMATSTVTLADQVRLVREQGNSMVTEVSDMRGHATAAAKNLAQDLTEASGTLKDRIKGLLDSTVSSQEEVQSQLDTLRNKIVSASAVASEKHAKEIDSLALTSQRAQELAATVTRETSAAAEGLRKVLIAIPDPGAPMRQYSGALGEAARSIGEGVAKVNASTSAVDAQLQVLLTAASNLGGQTEATVGNAQEALKAISDTFAYLGALEAEYVKIVEELHSRVRREAS